MDKSFCKSLNTHIDDSFFDELGQKKIQSSPTFITDNFVELNRLAMQKQLLKSLGNLPIQSINWKTSKDSQGVGDQLLSLLFLELENINRLSYKLQIQLKKHCD